MLIKLHSVVPGGYVKATSQVTLPTTLRTNFSTTPVGSAVASPQSTVFVVSSRPAYAPAFSSAVMHVVCTVEVQECNT